MTDDRGRTTGPGWQLPTGRWVLHSNRLLGETTERWIDTQAATGDRYEGRLLGGRVVDGQPPRPHWLVARERPSVWLGFRGMWRSRGLSTPLACRAFKRHPPAVLHAHYGCLAAFQISLARGIGATLVASYYGFDATKTRFTESSVWRRRYARLFAAAGAVLAEGPAMGSRIEALGCPPEKIRIVPLAADEPALASCAVRPSAGFQVVLAGRFIEKKGFEMGIRAFARALRADSDARLLVIGGGPLEDRLKRVALEERLGDQVVWGGRMPFRQFMECVAGSDVALYPSRTAANGDSEGGAPVTLIESQWLGTPSIVSDHDDLPYVAAPNGSIVLPDDDLQAWAEALLDLRRDPDRVQAMAEEASMHSKKQHSILANLRAREDIYRDVTSKAG